MKPKKKARPQKYSPEWHQLQIAKKTLKMTDVGALIMGGMTKAEASEIVKKYSSSI